MSTRPSSIRIPEETRRAIEEVAKSTKRTFSSIVDEMLTEAVKMRRIPGIVFADGPSGRRARLGGTGIEVFEVAMTYRTVDQSWDRLRAAFHWLSEFQLRAALAYLDAYPEEFEEILEEYATMTPEKLWARYPLLRPGSSAILPR